MHHGAKDNGAVPDGAVYVPKEDAATNLGFQAIREKEMEQIRRKTYGEGNWGTRKKKISNVRKNG